MKAQLNNSLIKSVSGTLSSDDKFVFRVRNGKQQFYPKSTKPFVSTPGRVENQKRMSEASRITKIIMESPNFLKPFKAKFNAYNPDDHHGKKYETLRGYVFHIVFESLKSNIPIDDLLSGRFDIR